MNRLTLPVACSRRQFLSRCAACVGCAAGAAWLQPGASRAAESSAGKPKIRLVFCETTNDKPIWPNIGYDFDTRRNRLLQVLTEGCPDVQLLPTQVMDDPKQAAEVLQGDGEVDGYLICVQGLGWGNDIVKLCATGKPTLLVDNLFGGSGLFLTKLPQIMAAGKPVDWVSSADDQDHRRLGAEIRAAEIGQERRRCRGGVPRDAARTHAGRDGLGLQGRQGCHARFRQGAGRIAPNETPGRRRRLGRRSVPQSHAGGTGRPVAADRLRGTGRRLRRRPTPGKPSHSPTAGRSKPKRSSNRIATKSRSPPSCTWR